MDLAEIRKKARLQNTSEDTEPQDSCLPQPATIDVEEVSSNVCLDEIWGAGNSQGITTEEDYVRDLRGHEVESEANAVQWLTFFLSGEEYALELTSVQELIRPRHLTELPQVPDYLLGIVSLRGVIVPVVDLGRRLQLNPVVDDGQQRVIVCSFDDQCIGLLVDKVNQVVRINSNQVEAPPLIPDAPAEGFIGGVGRIQGRMLILLQPEKVLDIEPLEVLQS